jgi:predicted XRE-type DNA-binding protein
MTHTEVDHRVSDAGAASPNLKRSAPPLDGKESHRVRSILMARLREMSRSKGLTQVEAARWFGVSQPRISHLVRNRTNRFTTDTLIDMLAHADVRVTLTFELSGRKTLARFENP